MHIYDLFGYREYMYMHDQGYVRENTHPTLDLKIINYTEKAQFDNEWNNVTAQCRGLIVNSEGTIIARPFDKFMNFGQSMSDFSIPMSEPVRVTDKLDGSLGIFWQYQGEQGIATRGSFTSDQAIHATEIWNTKYRPLMGTISNNWTYLFEIIYPENRIVLHYGDKDDLVLLGARSILTGDTLAAEDVSEWLWEKTTTFPYKTLREALEAPDRHNAEGLVVYFPYLNYRIKLKQEDYVALHKIVTGLTERRVWENMAQGQTLADMCEVIPDEWHDWLKETYKKIRMDFLLIKAIVESDYRQLVKALDRDGEWTRKDFAQLATSGEWGDYPGMMFTLLDGKEIDDAVWKLVKPSAE